MAPGDAVADARSSSQTLQLTGRTEGEKCHQVELLGGGFKVFKSMRTCWGWASQAVAQVAAVPYPVTAMGQGHPSQYLS